MAQAQGHAACAARARWHITRFHLPVLEIGRPSPRFLRRFPKETARPVNPRMSSCTHPQTIPTPPVMFHHWLRCPLRHLPRVNFILGKCLVGSSIGPRFFESITSHSFSATRDFYVAIFSSKENRPTPTAEMSHRIHQIRYRRPVALWITFAEVIASRTRFGCPSTASLMAMPRAERLRLLGSPLR